jgi:hypothetical protein
MLETSPLRTVQKRLGRSCSDCHGVEWNISSHVTLHGDISMHLVYERSVPWTLTEDPHKERPFILWIPFFTDRQNVVAKWLALMLRIWRSSSKDSCPDWFSVVSWGKLWSSACCKIGADLFSIPPSTKESGIHTVYWERTQFDSWLGYYLSWLRSFIGFRSIFSSRDRRDSVVNYIKTASLKFVRYSDSFSSCHISTAETAPVITQ